MRWSVKALLLLGYNAELARPELFAPTGALLAHVCSGFRVSVETFSVRMLRFLSMSAFIRKDIITAICVNRRESFP